MKKIAKVSVLSGTLIVLTGCAAQSSGPANEHKDSFKRYNQSMHKFNSGLYEYAIHPAGKVVDFVLPEIVEESLFSVLENLTVPNTALNNLAQGKPKSAGDDLMRFGVNTTVGIGGIIDWASMWGIPKNEEDFGQTLASYGVVEGPYVVLPVLGGTTLRGLSGVIVNADPTYLLGSDDRSIVQGVGAVVMLADSADMKELPTYEKERQLYYATSHCSVLDGRSEAAESCALACEEFAEMIDKELNSIDEPMKCSGMEEKMQSFMPSYCKA
jgi:phospholipid-binding lipoprotein MlaA